MCIYWVNLEGYDSSSVVEIGVGLRLIRCVRFMAYTSLFDLTAGVINKIRATSMGLVGFVFTLYLTWAILGMQLFGGKICIEALASTNSTCPSSESIEDTDYYTGKYYAINFNDLMMSALTLFVIMVGNNWNEVVDAYTTVMTNNARWYFLIWFVLVVYIALNTTLSFIIDTYINEERSYTSKIKHASRPQRLETI